MDSGRAEQAEGGAIIAAIKESGVEFVVALPDIVTCDSLLWPLSEDPDLRLVAVCKEDEGVSICAGLAFCERRALLMMQHTGLLDSINAIRAIAVEYGNPVCMLVGLQGLEPGRAPGRSDHYGLRIVEPILEAMGIAHRRLATASDVAGMAREIDRAYADARPLVFLIPRSPL